MGRKRSEGKFIGFDARTVLPPLPADWTHERRERYLVRLDATSVLSVDPRVWPRAQLDASPSNFRWVGDGRLSPNLPDLQGRMHAGEKSKTTIVAISVEADGGANMGMWEMASAQVSMPDARWTFVGHDIADDGFFSGLSNCGYSPDEAISTRERFAADLSDFHMFVERAVADEFRRFTDRRVPEHAPFYVFGLYTLSD